MSIISYYFSADASLRFCNRTNSFVRACSNRSYVAGRLVMHFSGMIELWVQEDRTSEDRTWSLIEAEQRDNCSVYNFCGKFGSCNPNNKLACKCLPGFMPDVPEKWHSGDFTNGCAKNNQSCEDRNTFLSLKMMMGGDKPQESYYGVDENECKETYLRNCECKTYSYDERSSCQIWTKDLLNLQEEYLYGYNLFVRVAISDIGNLLSVRFYFLYEFA